MGTVTLTRCSECGEHMPNGTVEHRCPEVVLVCGSRDWHARPPIERAIAELPKGSVVITGGARGADRIAAQVARRCSLHVAVVEPLWDRYGGAAGRIRNSAMLRLRPSRVLAFWDGESPGTRHTIEAATEQGVPVEVLP